MFYSERNAATIESSPINDPIPPLSCDIANPCTPLSPWNQFLGPNTARDPSNSKYEVATNVLNESHFKSGKRTIDGFPIITPSQSSPPIKSKRIETYLSNYDTARSSQHRNSKICNLSQRTKRSNSNIGKYMVQML